LDAHGFELHKGVTSPGSHVAIHWKVTIHPKSLKKFQKLHKHIAFTMPCPNQQKAILVAFVLLRLPNEGQEEVTFL
jgi:hypothetical protein